MEDPQKNDENLLEKPLRSLKSKILRIVSWVTGISLGTLLFVIAAVVVAVLIFVRTETFQNGLRNQVLLAAQKQLDANITFDTAKVKILRLEPAIEFSKVKIELRKSKETAVVDRIAIGMSLFSSIPALFFKKLHLSYAEIEGFGYRITDLKDIEQWLNSYRPKSVFMPSAFQTSIGEIRLLNVNFDLALTDPGISYLKGLRGKIKFERVGLELSASEIEFSGNVQLIDVQTPTFGPFSGSLELKNASHTEKRTQFGGLKIKSGDDGFEFSGEVKRWSNPILNIRGKLNANLEHFTKTSAVSGSVVSDFVVRGPWQEMEGSGSLVCPAFNFRGKEFKNIKSEFSLQFPQLELKNLEWSSDQEHVSGKGTLKLEQQAPLELDIKIDRANIGSYLGSLNPKLRAWKGDVSGAFQFSGRLLPESSGKINWDLKADGFDIRTVKHDLSIVSFPEVKTKGEAVIENVDEGGFSVKAETTGGSQWVGSAKWDKKNFSFEWTGQFNGGNLGTFYSHKLALLGSLKGKYQGPRDHLVMTVEPQLAYYGMAGFKFNNLRGKLMLENRVLYGAPLSSDEAEVLGGIRFTPPEVPNEFASLHVKLRKFEVPFLMQLFGAEQIVNDPERRIGGFITSDSVINGSFDEPAGSGNLLVEDWTLGRDQTRGRRASSNWALAEGEAYFDAVELKISAESKPIRAEISLDHSGVSDLWAEGQGVRLSDWSYLFRLDLNIQGQTDFRIDYQRDLPSLKAKMHISRSSLAGVEQEDSDLELEWLKDKMKFSGKLFGSSLVLDGSAKELAKTREAKLNFKFQRFNAIALLNFEGVHRIQTPMNGDGEVSWSTPKSSQNLMKALFTERGETRGDFQIRSAEVKKGNVTVQSLDAFQIRLRPSPSGHSRWSIDTLKFRSGEHLLQLKGYYESLQAFSFEVQGESDIRSFGSLLPVLSRSEGQFKIDGTFNPRGFSGKTEIYNGLIAIQNSSIVVRNVEMTLKAADSRFDVQRLRGELKEGSVSGTGWIKLSGIEVSQANMNLNLDSTLVVIQQGFSFRASGPLALRVQGTDQGELSGKMTINEGLFRKRLDVKADLLRFLEPEKREFKPLVEQEPSWRLWKLNVQLVTGDPFKVRNNVAEGSAEMNLLLTGTLREPQLKGSINIQKGQFTFNNRQFTIQSGSIQFQEQKSNIPSYDIRAETDIDIYRVDINLVGGPDSQKIRYTSDPVLGEKDILALISFGTLPQTDPTEIREKGDTKRSAAYTGISFVTGQLQDRLEGRLTTDLGIRRFSILPQFYEQTGKTELQLTIGTDIIQNRLALNYSNFLSTSGGHKVELDLLLNRYAHLVGSWRDVETQGGSGDFGGDLRFRFEFE